MHAYAAGFPGLHLIIPLECSHRPKGVFIIYVRGAGKIRGGGASNVCVAQKGGM